MKKTICVTATKALDMNNRNLHWDIGFLIVHSFILMCTPKVLKCDMALNHVVHSMIFLC